MDHQLGVISNFFCRNLYPSLIRRILYGILQQAVHNFFQRFPGHEDVGCGLEPGQDLYLSMRKIRRQRDDPVPDKRRQVQWA